MLRLEPLKVQKPLENLTNVYWVDDNKIQAVDTHQLLEGTGHKVGLFGIPQNTKKAWKTVSCVIATNYKQP